MSTPYPVTLPAPLLGRRHTRLPRPLVTVMESERVRVRPQYTESLELMDVQWNFTVDQFQTFESFFRNTLSQGEGDFALEVLGTTFTLAFFPATYSFAKSDNLFSVTATLEVLGTSAETSENSSSSNPGGDSDWSWEEESDWVPGGPTLIPLPPTGTPASVTIDTPGSDPPPDNPPDDPPAGYTRVMVTAGYYAFGEDINFPEYLAALETLLWEQVRFVAEGYGAENVYIMSPTPIWSPWEEEQMTAKLSVGAKVNASIAFELPISATNGVGNVYLNSHPMWTKALYIYVKNP